MKLARLRVEALRCLAQVDLELSDAVNVFVGPNGAGKTSLLEAVFLLSHGRSFRSGARDALLQRGERSLSIFAEVMCADASIVRVGLGREGSNWQARVDSQSVSLAEMLGRCAVVSFDPGTHALIAAGAEERRRFLDWGVFHVEHEFLPWWRRYQRALKQRNSLLRSRTDDVDLFEPWERELDAAAVTIDGWRRDYLERLRPLLASQASRLLPELGELTLRYRPGWPEQGSLFDALASQRSRDMLRGHTGVGLHRGDWSLAFEHAPLREHLSRGQEKLTAVACLLAQAEVYAMGGEGWPIVCIDDLASELDDAHQASLVDQLRAAHAQVLVTGTALPASLAAGTRVFHVEQGRVAPLL